MTAYIRFALILLFSTPVTFAGILLGGYWVWTGPLAIMAVLVLGDVLARPDRTMPDPSAAWPWNLLLYAQLPIAAAALFLLAWSAAPGDLGGTGALLQQWLPWPVLQRHRELAPLNLLGIAYSVGFLLSTNAVVAHELIHRTQSLPSMIVGRWLLAMIGDSQFSISHVYGHHRWVGTARDAATARRGESLYRFVLRSAAGQLRSAFDIERERLGKFGQPVWSIKNRFLTGQAMTLSIALLMFVLAGWAGLALLVLAAAYAKFLYEAVNYIQHYGLVRVEHTPIEPRHSWDCLALFSSCFLFNLTRHADHHARADVPFWRLEPAPDAIMLKYGYMGTILLAMVPPAWERSMAPLLRYWDEHLATTDEVAIAHAASRALSSRRALHSPSS